MKLSKKEQLDAVNQVMSARRMKHVSRLAGTPTIHRQSLAEHCYYTGILFLHCAKQEGIELSPEEVYFVFLHDAAEIVTGDLLWPAKHSGDNNEHWDTIEETALREQAPFLLPFRDNTLKGEALKLFRYCDMLELFLCVCEEKQMGNCSKEMETVFNNAWRFLSTTDYESVMMIAFAARGVPGEEDA